MIGFFEESAFEFITIGKQIKLCPIPCYCKTQAYLVAYYWALYVMKFAEENALDHLTLCSVSNYFGAAGKYDQSINP